MIEIEIPGGAPLRLEHLVLDYNGTLAADGALISGVGGRVRTLAAHLRVHVVTADTFGKVREEIGDLPCAVVVLAPRGQAAAKRDYVERLGATSVACIGNGRNDRQMIEVAALGIAVIQAEGAAAETIAAADVVAPTILDALDLLLHPQRLVATLRT
jgi:soluble P-type ATPase